MAKRGDEWFPLSQAVVAYDHARHAPPGDVITLDFINIGLDTRIRECSEPTGRRIFFESLSFTQPEQLKQLSSTAFQPPIGSTPNCQS